MPTQIAQLELEDYRSFRGEHSFKFGRTPGNHISLIHGPNASGKTSLMEALRICLYGHTKFDGPLPIVSVGRVEAMNNGEWATGNIATIVEKDRSERFRISRKIHSIKQDQAFNSKLGDLCVEKKSPKKGWILIDNPDEVRDGLFPQSVEPIKFFDDQTTIGLKSPGSLSLKELFKAANSPSMNSFRAPCSESPDSEFQRRFSKYLRYTHSRLQSCQYSFEGEYLTVSKGHEPTRAIHLPAGESVVISFLLLLLANEFEPSEGPLFADSPFGRLDSKCKESVRRLFKEANSRQLILFCHSITVDEVLDSHLSEDIAVNHELQYTEPGSKETN